MMWACAIVISEQNAKQAWIQRSSEGSEQRALVFEKVAECKKPGWYAVLVLSSEAREELFWGAGSCGQENLIDAQKAAVKSCMSKSACNSRLASHSWLLFSGYDSGRFDPIAGLPPNSWKADVRAQFPKYELCLPGEKTRTCASGWIGKERVDNCLLGSQLDDRGEKIPFDRTKILPK